MFHQWNNLHGTRPKYNRYVEVSLFLLIKHCIGESRGPGYSYIYRKQTQETLKVKTTMEKENIRPEKELRVYYLLQWNGKCDPSTLFRSLDNLSCNGPPWFTYWSTKDNNSTGRPRCLTLFDPLDYVQKQFWW